AARSPWRSSRRTALLDHPTRQEEEVARRATCGGAEGSATAEATPSQPQQDHAELAALAAEVAEAVEHRHLAVVDDARAARRHPRPADLLRHRAAPFDQPQDLGVEVVDLLAQRRDLIGGGDLAVGGRHAHGLLLVADPAARQS